MANQLKIKCTQFYFSCTKLIILPMNRCLWNSVRICYGWMWSISVACENDWITNQLQRMMVGTVKIFCYFWRNKCNLCINWRVFWQLNLKLKPTTKQTSINGTMPAIQQRASLKFGSVDTHTHIWYGFVSKCKPTILPVSAMDLRLMRYSLENYFVFFSLHFEHFKCKQFPMNEWMNHNYVILGIESTNKWFSFSKMGPNWLNAINLA